MNFCLKHLLQPSLHIQTPGRCNPPSPYLSVRLFMQSSAYCNWLLPVLCLPLSHSNCPCQCNRQIGDCTLQSTPLFSVLIFLNLPARALQTIKPIHPESLPACCLTCSYQPLAFTPAVWFFHFILLPKQLFLCPLIKCSFIPISLLISLEFMIPFKPIAPMLTWHCKVLHKFPPFTSLAGFLLLTLKWSNSISSYPSGTCRLPLLPSLFLYYPHTKHTTLDSLQLSAPDSQSGPLLHASGTHLMFSSTLATALGSSPVIGCSDQTDIRAQV